MRSRQTSTGKKSTRQIFLAGLFALILVAPSAFNSCSAVKFSQGDSVVGSQGGSTTPDPGSGPSTPPVCYGTNCITSPPMPKNYSDQFSIPRATSKVDVLLVLDNSKSMDIELKKLAIRMDGFVQGLDTAHLDWQICYTTTHVDNNPNAGVALDWLVPTTGAGTFASAGYHVLRPSATDRVSIFSTTMSHLPPSTTGAGNEQGIISAEKAVSATRNADCFRSDAALAVIIISDEDEKSCGARCKDSPASVNWPAAKYTDQYRPLTTEDNPAYFVEMVERLWPSHILTTHAIVIRDGDQACYETQDKEAQAFYGVEYGKLQKLTGGILGDICADSYASQLSLIGKRTQDSINSVSLRCAAVGTPVVRFDPLQPTITWQLVGNKILFSKPVPEGTMVYVDYTCLQ